MPYRKMFESRAEILDGFDYLNKILYVVEYKFQIVEND
jgi:hypothetical protein